MNLPKLAALLCLLALPCSAQLPGVSTEPPIRGTFYVSVDDSCTIFVNGVKAYHTGIGVNRSPELEVKIGDRIVVHLQNDTDGRHFIFLFASSDGQKVVSFKHENFRIVPDIGVTDFTPDQFQQWTKSPKEGKHNKRDGLPVKSYSEFMWGDLDKCIIAGTVTTQMVSLKPH